MTTVTVDLGARTYPVVVEAGVLARAADHLLPIARGRRIVVVADENVAMHLSALTDALGGCPSVILPPGEATKGWAMLEHLCDSLLGHGVERGDLVVALGGGVIGDLVGFACAILKRGCRFAQVPTTLLAQVDSSVGGKTAINTRAGKNLVGAFKQPEIVLIDPQVLDTLSPRELAAGYAEVVKYGLIDDAAFFGWCEENGAALLAGDAGARAHAIVHAVSAKARIVAADEYETLGLRALLNLGHTFGHALEAEAGFSQALIHGEAVAAGCALAFAFSAERGLCTAEDAGRVAAHFRSVGLPDGLAAVGIDAPPARLVEHMRHDKKMDAGTLPFLLAKGIGRTYLDRSVDLTEVEAFLARAR